MAGADLAAVDAVVAEVAVGDAAVVVAHEAELGDRLRVEGDLGLCVAGGQLDVARELLAEDLAGVLRVRHVRGVSVALVGEAFHQGVAVVAADADAEEGDAVLATLVRDAFEDGVRVGLAGVGEGVGDEDDAVGGALAAALVYKRQLDARAEVGGLGGLQAVDGVVDAAAAVAEPGHRQDGLGLVAEGDQRDRVVVAQPVGHRAQGLLGEVEAAGLGHGAGDVDDEGQGGRRAGAALLGAPGGQAHADQGPVLLAGAGAVHGHREAVAFGTLVVLAEAVDELLGADRRRVGQPTLGQGAAGVAVGGGVDVQGEGGEEVGFGGDLPGVSRPARGRALVVALSGLAARPVGCGHRRGAPAPGVHRRVLRAPRRVLVSSPAAGEQQAARRREREQRADRSSCPVSPHLPCPLFR